MRVPSYGNTGAFDIFTRMVCLGGVPSVGYRRRLFSSILQQNKHSLQINLQQPRVGVSSMLQVPCWEENVIEGQAGHKQAIFFFSTRLRVVNV